MFQKLDGVARFEMDLWAEDYEFSHNYTARISLGIGTFVNTVVFFVQFPYSTFTDDIFKKQSEKNIKHSTGSTIFLKIWAHILGYILSFLCLVSSVNTFRGYWYLMDEYFMAGEGDYEKSLINSKIYGALILFVCHCGCSLHAGIYKDVSQEKGGNLIEYYYTSYFFIKVNSLDFF